MRSKLFLVPILVGLMCLAGWTAHAKLQKDTAARQMWEYQEVELDARFQATPKLNQFGNQGWELVNVVSACPSAPNVAQSCRFWAYMKRAK